MPFPLIAIGAGIAVVSIGSTVHSSLKTRKWKKLHDEALDKCKSTETKAKAVASQFNYQAEQLGRLRISSMETLKDAATFLQKAKVKYREFENFNVSIPDETIAHWKELHQETLKSVGIGAAGIAGASGAAAVTAAGLYTAAGIFGVASTGVRIATLSGAAANSARLAWIGGGALAAGGAGMAGGVATMMTAANVVAAPIGIAAAAWGQWKAHQTKQKVEAAMRLFASAEQKMRQQVSVMKAGQLRMTELTGSIIQARSALSIQLGKSMVEDIETVHKVYKLAVALAELLEQPVLTEQQHRILQG